VAQLLGFDQRRLAIRFYTTPPTPLLLPSQAQPFERIGQEAFGSLPTCPRLKFGVSATPQDVSSH
jgi:hypothetical protein